MAVAYDNRTEEERALAESQQNQVARKPGDPMLTASQAASQASLNNQQAIQNPDGSFKFVPLTGGAKIQSQGQNNQAGIQNTIGADRQRVMGQQPAGGTGQFNPGTRQAPTLDQILAEELGPRIPAQRQPGRHAIAASDKDA